MNKRIKDLSEKSGVNGTTCQKNAAKLKKRKTLPKTHAIDASGDAMYRGAYADIEYIG